MVESYDHLAGEEMDVAFHPDNVNVYRPGIPSNTSAGQDTKDMRAANDALSSADTQRRNTYTGLINRQRGNADPFWKAYMTKD